MKTSDLSELAFRNLREAVLRNSLTTLGVAVGVASLVAMLSLGVGLQTLASQRLTRSGLFDAVFVTTQRNFRGPRQPPPPTPAPKQNARILDEDLRQQFSKLSNVTEVYPQIRFATDVRYADKSESTMVLGLPDSSRSSGAFDGMTGAFFSSPTAEEAILQIEFAKALTDQPPSLVGKDVILRYAERAALPKNVSDEDLLDTMMGSGPPGGVSIVPREKKFRIVGVIESDPSAGIGGFGGARVYLPLKTAEQLHVAQPDDIQGFLSGNSGKPTYIALTVRVRSPKDVPQVEAAIKNLGFSTFSLLDATKGLRLVFTVFDLFLGLFGSLALTVASLGIINTLVMAILERRREIGILKALGATDRDVRSLFFAEAGAMGLFGGLFGVALGWLIGQALNWGTTIYLHRQNLPGVKITFVPWWMVLGATGFAVLVSLIAGLYPASRAARLNPVEALRYE
ncbi:MAG TPA: FtsX-like permease family protein [Candidatus Acidoferrum sp.]|nr:FtsX-like permease family protein [Candidatus Acidoferrum sp.]